MSVFFPVLRYRDAHGAIDFLERAFGFEPRPSTRATTGAWCTPSSASTATSSCSARPASPSGPGMRPPPGSGAVYVVVRNDIDAHHDRAKAAGAEIVYGLRDQDYGSRDYSARDPEGNLWSFGTYAPA
jgi:uncharacterized glyoxalase superfamily protein PhnB